MWFFSRPAGPRGSVYFLFYETAGRNWPNARILRDGTQTFFDSSEAFHSPSFSILNNQLEVLGDITKNYPVWLILHGSSSYIAADQFSGCLNLLCIRISPTCKAKSCHALNLVVFRNVWQKKWMELP